MAHHIGGVVSVVLGGLDEADVLLGEDGAADAAEQFFGLAGEHGARDDLEGAADGMGWVPFVCRHDGSILRRLSTAEKRPAGLGLPSKKPKCNAVHEGTMGNVEPQGFGASELPLYSHPEFSGVFQL